MVLATTKKVYSAYLAPRACAENNPINIGPTSIGATGFEPAASCSQSRRSAKLSYAPRSGDCRLPVAESQGCDGVEAEFSSRESRQIAGGA
jgi:hypothetical protein